MTYSNIPIDVIYNDISNVKKDASNIGIEDILDVMDEDILKEVIDKAIGLDEYDGDYYTAAMDDSLQICSIRVDSTLGWCLARYIGEPAINPSGVVSEKWGKTLRGFCLQENFRIYFAHGFGYDWIDDDLLGGNGDGSKRKEFEDGITIAADYGKRD